jgi:hypothetical protein
MSLVELQAISVDVGEETPLSDADRIHVGAWTTITIALGQ